ncbi:MAG: energy-coupling factor transporter transmembrane component T family protein [Promethearchaeota archaeon]
MDPKKSNEEITASPTKNRNYPNNYLDSEEIAESGRDMTNNVTNISNKKNIRGQRKHKNKFDKIMQLNFSQNDKNTFFSNLHPVTKILWYISSTFFIIFQRSIIILIVFLVYAIINAWTNNMTPIFLLKKLKWIIIFIFSTIIANVLFGANPIRHVDEEVLFYTPLFNLPIRRYAAYISLRNSLWVLILITFGFTFLNTTSSKELSIGLQKLGLNYKLSYSFMIGMRYAPIIQNTTNYVKLAQKARGLDVENVHNIKKGIELIKDRLTSSLISIFRYINYTSIALELRAFGVHKKRLEYNSIKFHKQDFIFLCLFFAFSILLTLWSRNTLSFLPDIPSIYSIFKEYFY